MPTAALITLGCKVNQYDTQAMQEVMLRNGYTVVGKMTPPTFVSSIPAR